MKQIKVASPDSVHALACLVGVAHHASQGRSVGCASALPPRLLLADPLAQQSNAGCSGLGLTTCSYHRKLPTVLLIELISESILAFTCRSPIDMIVNWILYSTETETSIKYSPAIFFVSLTKARILMKLR